MNREEIIRMAREAGISLSNIGVICNRFDIEKLVEYAFAEGKRVGVENCVTTIQSMSHGNVTTCTAAIRDRGDK